MDFEECLGAGSSRPGRGRAGSAEPARYTIMLEGLALGAIGVVVVLELRHEPIAQEAT